MSKLKNGLSHLSWHISKKLLNILVTPQLLGKHPNLPSVKNDGPHEVVNGSKLTCYILQNYSKSNALVVDSETRRLSLAPALDAMVNEQIDEDTSIIFLNNTHQNEIIKPLTDSSPRLLRLIDAALLKDNFDVELVPVTILWGRAPDQEDSWLKLLLTDAWETPGKLKQLINIGVHGRQTFLIFHEVRSLRKMINEATYKYPTLSPAAYIISTFNDYLKKQREVIIGPDLSDRRTLIGSLMKTHGMRYALEQETMRSNISLSEAEDKAISYLNEIVSNYSYSVMRIFEIGLTRLWTQLYDGVDVHHFDTVRDLAEDYELVYAPCHRSHIDYLLLSFVIYKRGLRIPYIAAGNNLNLPVLEKLLRGGGGFFIRRTFKGMHLYSAVLKEYLHSILVRDNPLEYFIEGGRSRTGRLLQPKTGMLAMTIHSKLRGGGKPIAFIPTYIGYERLMEGATYVGEMQGKPKEAESILGLIGAIRKIERIFGKVHVSFGEPVFLDKVLKANSCDKIQLYKNEEPIPLNISNAINAVALEIMKNINRAAVINPVSLLSLVLLATPKHALDEEVCIKQLDTYRNLAKISPYDERIETTSLTGREIIAYGLKLKLIKRVKHALGDIISIEDTQAVLLTYFRNNILHLYILPSLIASLVQQNGHISRNDIHNVIKTLYPFLQAELFLKWRSETLQNVIEQVISSLIKVELVLDDGNNIYSTAPNSEAFNHLSVMATPVKQSLERYFITLTLLNQYGSGNVSTKQIEEICYLLGQRLSVLYEFNSPDFFDKSLFQSFIKELTKLNYLCIDANKNIIFDERLIIMANNAHLVLDENTLENLQSITNFNSSELQMNITEFNKQKKLRKLKS